MQVRVPGSIRGLCPIGVVALTPWSVTIVLCTGGKLQLKAAEQFSSDHLGKPPNPLATAVAPESLPHCRVAGHHQGALHCSQGVTGSRWGVKQEELEI